MKNIFSISSVLVGVMILFVSCLQDEISGNNIPDECVVPIEFSALSGSLEVKSYDLATTVSYIQDNGFKVWASSKVGNLTSNEVFSNKGTDVAYKRENTSWTYSPVRYWQPGEYTFMAVSPSSIMTEGELSYDGLTLSFSDGWNLSENQKDILLAVTSGISGESHLNTATVPESVPLDFKHQLSLIKFQAKNVDSKEVAVVVTGIRISGNHKTTTAMSYQLSDSSVDWTLSGETSGYQSLALPESSTSISIPKDAYSDITSEILVFPEKCEELIVEVTFTDTHNGATSVANVKSATIKTEWKAGKQYIYKINISFDTISFDVPTVIDWADGGNIENDDIEM